MNNRKKVIVLGATGSIGKQTLEIARQFPEYFQIVAMSTHKNEQELLNASACFENPALCVSGKEENSEQILYSGREGLFRMIQSIDADIVINGISGSAGLEPSVFAIKSGMDLALANKESLVMAGRILMELAEKKGKKIIPVDSEHSAIFRLLLNVDRQEIREIVITASGGAFRDRPISEFEFITPMEATVHPTWSMGKKITIDSATMANKGLEIIEAVKLFNIQPDLIRVLIHPQSIVHALVHLKDGDYCARMSNPDMRNPVLYALSWPKIIEYPFEHISLADKTLEFTTPDPKRYPILERAYDALEDGEGACIAFNASNEIAVDAFISGKIRFTDIDNIIEKTLDNIWPKKIDLFEEILNVDQISRNKASLVIKDSFQ